MWGGPPGLGLPGREWLGWGPGLVCEQDEGGGGCKPWWLGLHSTHVLMGMLFVIWELADSR